MHTAMAILVKRFMAEQEGATMVEYSLMLGLISIACLGAITVVGTTLARFFGAVASAVAAAP